MGHQVQLLTLKDETLVGEIFFTIHDKDMEYLLYNSLNARENNRNGVNGRGQKIIKHDQLIAAVAWLDYTIKEGAETINTTINGVGETKESNAIIAEVTSKVIGEEPDEKLMTYHFTEEQIKWAYDYIRREFMKAVETKEDVLIKFL